MKKENCYEKNISIILMLSIIWINNLFIKAEINEVEDNTGEITGVIFENETEQEYLNTLSSEKRIICEQKIRDASSLENIVLSRSATKVSIPGTFTMYRQENGD